MHGVIGRLRARHPNRRTVMSMGGVIRGVLLAAMGFALGAVVMAYQARKASEEFLDLARLNLREHQMLRAACADRRGDLDQAIFHYSELANDESASFLSRTGLAWTVTFPLFADILREIREAHRSE